MKNIVSLISILETRIWRIRDGQDRLNGWRWTVMQPFVIVWWRANFFKDQKERSSGLVELQIEAYL